MVAQHYRWDFIGLSTDTKPTPETSEKVVDGSTFYCSDNSKLYVFCKDTWYEKTVSGGGGGASYTAGDGIDIENNTISVDTNTIQAKLTAGTGIDITDNVISAIASGGITELTEDMYDYPTSSPKAIAIWKLPAGIYHAPTGVKHRCYGTSSNYQYEAYFIVGTPESSAGSPVGWYEFRIGNPSVITYGTTSLSSDSYIAVDTVASLAKGNTLVTVAPTTSTVGVLGQIITDTTNMHTYQCTAISGSTYTWTQRW